MESSGSSYSKLVKRINIFPLGAPPSKTLYKILTILFSEKEAELVSQLPIKPFTISTASRVWRTDMKTAEVILEQLASRAILLDIEDEGVKRYILPPPMAGFFEFSIMRTRGDIDQKLLSELYYQYLNVEDEFVTDLFLGSETRLGRVFVQEKAISSLNNDNKSSRNTVQILDYERASYMLESATHIGISNCYCRTKMKYVDQGCDAPMNICMTLNNTARSLIKHQHARQVELAEGLELLQKAYEHNLVQCGENARKNISFICNCCGCCCEALIAAKKFGILRPVHTSNFLPVINEHTCSGCGLCVKKCPINAITLINDDIINQRHGQKHVKVIAKIDNDICLGCGVCVRTCHKKSITLIPRAERVITPVDSVHRTVLMAIERGKLHQLIFDNQALVSHRAMAAILASILRLPPLKQAMASKQMKSVYLEKLISRFS